MLTRSECFNGPDAYEWLQADTKERTTLEAMGCWRPVTDEDYESVTDFIPSAVIYTKKRCGTHKARLVALGNRQSPDGLSEIYSPTVSHIANRMVLIDAAAHGHHITGFDLTAAFINAHLQDDECILMRLPKQWSTDEKKGDVVRLIKCIYGLKQAPRRWFDTFSAFLREREWVRCDHEPGVWKKGSMVLTIYVDDSLIVGPDKGAIEKEQDEMR